MRTYPKKSRRQWSWTILAKVCTVGRSDELKQKDKLKALIKEQNSKRRNGPKSLTMLNIAMMSPESRFKLYKPSRATKTMDE